MPNFIIAYHGEVNQPKSPEEASAHMAKWQAWVQGLGNAVVNPGSPLGKSKLVTPKGVAEDNLPDKMTGFSVVKADSLDAALEMAKSCPYVEVGGTLKVAQLMEMGAAKASC